MNACAHMKQEVNVHGLVLGEGIGQEVHTI